jgi:hypothetical protein
MNTNNNKHETLKNDHAKAQTQGQAQGKSPGSAPQEVASGTRSAPGKDQDQTVSAKREAGASDKT